MNTNLTLERNCRIGLLLAALGLTALAFGQWSTDPANPLQLASGNIAQDGLVAFGDGNGGCYAFWRDKRGNGTQHEVYGQHLDSTGMALWAPGGALVHGMDSCDITEFAIARMGNGNFMLAFMGRPALYQDTLKALLLSPDCLPLWDHATYITKSGYPVLGLGELTLTPTSDGAIIGWYDTYFGGSNGVNVVRVNENGDQLWAPEGFAIPGAAYGPFGLQPDGADGALVYWRDGNGLGAGYHGMRVNGTGAPAWGSNVLLNAGGPGFSGSHQAIVGAANSVLMAYASTHIRLIQVDTSGNQVFTPSPIEVCAFNSSQDSPKLTRKGAQTVVVWTDNRPPANYQDLYMQVLNASGIPQLDPDGVPVMQTNTYIPTSGLINSTGNTVIATMDGTVAGYSAMRMNLDGSPAWPAPTAFCTPANNPAYSRQLQLPDGEGGILSVWQTFDSRILAARIYSNGDLGSLSTSVANLSAEGTKVFAWPNPAKDVLHIDLPGGAAIVEATVIGSLGTRTPVKSCNGSIRVAQFPAGHYIARVATADDAVHHIGFIKE
ncbi:MAG: T9SS type A sorting domain-containing protein [Bacteroidetes bacterium]|nr:T9SS type A sorting domain-containing protein [Bacteroidota bacterium]